ncbi:MAG TPA: carboxypeptidase-like regulatory domain-containing protein [Pyrinomonadaceae bacterium]
MKPLRLSAAALLVLIIGCAASVFAQSDRGSIRGTVTDVNGAAIAGGRVILTGTETGEVRETTTGDEGIYVFPEVRAGIYQISVEAQGFQKTTINDFKVAVQVTHGLDIKLAVGAITNEVTVVAETEAIQSDTPVRQTNVTERQVKELPLGVSSESGGRTPLSFIFLDSNVGATDTSGNNNASNFRVSGGQGAGVEILIDGSSTRRTQNGNFFTEVAPGPNAYQEFTISTNSYSAEFGNSSGGIVNFTLKSGTNEFHGEAYDIVRNEVFNANTIENNARGFKRNRDNQNNYGFNIGGPIYIPNFGEGTPGGFLRSLKDRAFFFFNYEGYRFIRGANSLTTVPTVKMRNGDFSEYLTDPYVLGAFPGGIRIFDPRQPFNVRQQFPGNIIPSSAFDPAGYAIMQYFPLPNRPGVHDNYASSVTVPNVSNQFTIKTDFVISDRQRLTFSYSRKDNERIAGPTPVLPLPFVEAFSAWNQTFRSNIGRIQHDFTITPTLLNHLNIGYTFYDVRNDNTTVGFDTASLGIPRNATLNLAFPLIDFVGASNNANDPRFSADIGGVDFTDRLRDGALEIGDFVTYVTGRQTFKFGASFRIAQFNVLQALHPGGRFGFHEGQTSREGVPNSGSALASLITGATEWSFTENSAFEPAFRQLSQSYFIQDDIKLTQKLTLNVGLRYDLPGQRTEANNHYRSFDPEAINPVIGRPGAIVGAAGQGGLQAEFRSLAPEDKTNIGPRLGVAYAFNSKTVIRGGIGLYYAPILYGLNGAGTIKGGTIGYNIDSRFVPNGNDTPPNQFLSNFRPLTPINPNDQFVGNLDVVLPFFDKEFKTGRTLQYTVDLQRELPYNFVASIGYIGHRADRLRSNFGRFNALPLNTLRLGFQLLTTNVNDLSAAQRAYATSVGVTLPANANAVYPGFNGNVAQALRPFPQYGTNIDNYLESKGESDYNALQLKLERRFAQGFQFGASYTFSRLITNASEDILGGGSALSGVLQNPFDLNSLKTVSATNSPHVFVVNFLAELPFGKGKAYLNKGGFVNAVFGGWQVGGIFRYQQGTPLVFAVDPDYGTYGNYLSLFGYNGNLRPNLTGADISSAAACNPNVAPAAGRRYVLNCGAFSAPPDYALFETVIVNGNPQRVLIPVTDPRYAAYYTDPLRFFGNAPAVNTDVRSSPYFSENLNILKKTRLTENITFEVGAEIFNLFNRVRYFVPDTFLGRPNGNGSFGTNSNSNFGAEGAANVDPQGNRIIQFRARIIF